MRSEINIKLRLFSRKIDYNLYIEIDEDDYIYDAKYLELITGNLLFNTFKYTGDSEAITVKLRKGDNSLLIEVIDTGIGIAREKQEKIFERFFRYITVGAEVESDSL